jgi:hypothetical protein
VLPACMSGSSVVVCGQVPYEYTDSLNVVARDQLRVDGEVAFCTLNTTWLYVQFAMLKV